MGEPDPLQHRATEVASPSPLAETQDFDALEPEDAEFMKTYPAGSACYCLYKSVAFYEAQVKKYFINDREVHLLVHYPGWNNNYDEVMHVNDARCRLLPHNEQSRTAIERENRMATRKQNWNVEGILQERRRGKGMQYLVKWVGWEKPTWEPGRNLKHTYYYKQWQRSHGNPLTKDAAADGSASAPR